jgi:hypothetical protein
LRRCPCSKESSATPVARWSVHADRAETLRRAGSRRQATGSIVLRCPPRLPSATSLQHLAKRVEQASSPAARTPAGILAEDTVILFSFVRYATVVSDRRLRRHTRGRKRTSTCRGMQPAAMPAMRSSSPPWQRRPICSKPTSCSCEHRRVRSGPGGGSGRGCLERLMSCACARLCTSRGMRGGVNAAVPSNAALKLPLSLDTGAFITPYRNHEYVIITSLTTSRAWAISPTSRSSRGAFARRS